ncbi:MAG: BspA family leucine-rich repeat surface protein [Anaerolineae bacterium]|jgi:surface protein|nr:BspA family leucine-rich repeat surface protein [Anaerolineae bacterium]
MNRFFRFCLMTSFLLGMLLTVLPQSDVIAAPVFTPSPDDFIITVNTANFGGSSSIEFIVPTIGEGYDFNVDCDNNGTDEIVGATSSYTCSYGVPGIYTVRISSNDPSGNGYPRVYFGFISSDVLKLLTIEQWGSTTWSSMEKAFIGAENLTINATDAPDLSAATSTAQMFEGAASLNQDISDWDVSNITDMSRMFYDATAFNQPLNDWNVSSVTDMSEMFYGAEAFNQPLFNWNTVNVTNMSSMFEGATSFNTGLSAWNTGNVTDMSRMFYGASAFNGALNGWDVSSVTNMNEMFRGVTAFNQPLNGWNTGSVTTMRNMFTGAVNFDQPLDNWDTSAVTDMSGMFSVTNSFNRSLNDWNVSKVTDMSLMFLNANAFNQPLNGWDTGETTNMSTMFTGADVFNQPLNTWDTGKVTTMFQMFSDAVSFDQDLGDWDVTSLTNAGLMFQNVTLSTSNYDNLLIGWHSQLAGLQSNVTFDGGDSNFCTADTERQALITSRTWTITDGGLDCTLDVPVLLSPADSSSIWDLTPTFDWTDVPDADGYSLFIADNMSLTGATQVDLTESTYTPAAELGEGTWYWQVTATSTNPDRDSSDSGIWSFTINAGALSQPVLVAPADGSTTPDRTPTFDWEDVTGATGYTLQLADNPEFSGALEVSVAVSEFTPGTDRDLDMYYWRVRATSATAQSGSSEVWSFEIIEGTTPIILGPPDGHSTTDHTPNFDWEDVPGAVSYIIQVSPTSNFSALPINHTVSNSFFAPGIAMINQLYYWRVTANLGGTLSPWSEVRTITITGAPGNAAPVAVSPDNGATTSDRTPTFEWTAVPTAVRYRIQISPLEGFGVWIVNQTVNAPITEWTPGVNFNPGTYWWRVQAEGGGDSSWFTIKRSITITP